MVGEYHHHLRVPVTVGRGTLLASSVRGWSSDGGQQANAGIYLDHSWLSKLGMVGHRILSAGKHPATIMFWPDMGVPDRQHFALALDWVNLYLSEGKAVEVACVGGHGRTGTLIACALREYGASLIDAVSTVRDLVCQQCVETVPQRDLIQSWERRRT